MAEAEPTFPSHPTAQAMLAVLRLWSNTGELPPWVNQADVYALHPAVLTASADCVKSTASDGTVAWYHLQKLRPLETCSSRSSRTCGGGTWQGERARPVVRINDNKVPEQIGWQNSLTFGIKGVDKRFVRKGWKMLEVYLMEDKRQIISKIYHSPRIHPEEAVPQAAEAIPPSPAALPEAIPPSPAALPEAIPPSPAEAIPPSPAEAIPPSPAALPEAVPSPAEAIPPSPEAAPAKASPALPVKASSPALPVEASSPALPVKASSPALPVKTSSPALPVKASSPALPVKASSPALPVKASSPALPVKASSPALPVKASPALPVKASSPALPVKASPALPVKAASPALPVKASPAPHAPAAAAKRKAPSPAAPPNGKAPSPAAPAAEITGKKWIRVEISGSPTKRTGKSIVKEVFRVVFPEDEEDEEEAAGPPRKKRATEYHGWLAVNPVK